MCAKRVKCKDMIYEHTDFMEIEPKFEDVDVEENGASEDGNDLEVG